MGDHCGGITLSGRQAAVYSVWNGEFAAEAAAAAVAGDGYWDPMQIPVSLKETGKQWILWLLYFSPMIISMRCFSEFLRVRNVIAILHLRLEDSIDTNQLTRQELKTRLGHVLLYDEHYISQETCAAL